MRLAIFGGSFDPIHIGHLSIAEEVRVSLGYNEVIFIPSNVPPHKPPSQMVATGDRIAMVKLATADNEAFRLDTFEVDRGGVSFTIDTIRHLIDARTPDDRLGLIIGDDLIAGFPKWKEAEEIGRLCDVIVARRLLGDGTCVPPSFATSCRKLNNLLVPISSSDVRDRIRTGQSFRYLVPERVYAYISSHRLYQP